ncbi:MAG: hypothetical protein M5U34_34100 [Chloroflexi bacterium]|nr:hypothetical protein [Chloroflexota bacterium]
MKQLLILWLMLFAVACTPATQTSPHVAAPTATDTYDFSGVHLRLHNDTGQNLTDVALIVGEDEEQLGLLPQNAVSNYVTFTAVQQSPTIHVTIGEIAPEWTASADAGAGLIAGGQFTLELTLDNDQLTVDLLMENPILYDAQYYADEMGVTLAEALARLDTQSEDAISALQSQLQTHEADTFAGLWLQHEPAYRVVVAFTRDGEETIQKYVAPDSQLAELIEIRPVEFTYAQLQADQQAVLRILDGTALSVGVGIMVMDNRVAVDVADRAAFDAALAAADTTLPESVVVTTVYQPVEKRPPLLSRPYLICLCPN